MLARIGFVVTLASVVALAGCGRKGPLEPPVGVVEQKPVAKAVAPAPADSTAPGGLFRNTSDKSEDPAVPTATGERKARGSAPFVLDPLLQ